MLQNALAGSFRIFRFFGITVYLHWAWFLLAWFQMQRDTSYSSSTWLLLEFIAIFAIVTLHEFGHALACRSVGGQADTIVLWPLGGVAFCQPPQRPGAVLWSIAAGPLVNVVLMPILIVIAGSANIGLGSNAAASDLQTFASHVAFFNIAIFVFNMLPIYPLDGGQIVQSLLWFIIGRSKSLRIVAFFGLIASGLGLVYALLVLVDIMLVAIALFIGWQSWTGYRTAILMAEQDARLREVIGEKYSNFPPDRKDG